MEQKRNIAVTPKIAVPIRVRGMTHENRFFDVQTETTRLTEEFIVVSLPNLVDLDTELHVTSLQTEVGGVFRVAWVNQLPKNESYSVGLELLDPEGVIWEPGSIPQIPETSDAPPDVLMECRRCIRQEVIPLSEADPDSLGEGFTLARHCDTCKGTTAWVYVVDEPAPETPEAAPTAPAQREEQRSKGRAPIKMPVKVVRKKYGTPVSDVGETINVSRTGVLFATRQHYDKGEMVEVILPYRPETTDIPVRAQVVRQDVNQENPEKRVAVHMISGKKS